MPETSPLAFSLRDIFQKVFPTIIGLCLFAPLVKSWGEPPEVEAIIFAGVVLSYLVTPPIRKFADFYSRHPIFFSSRRKKIEQRRKWVERNWNYERLHTHLDKDELELLDEDGNLIVFYRVVALDLLAYLAWNLYLALNAFHYDLGRWREIATVAHWRKVWPVLTDLKTPVLGIGEVPTYAALSAALFLLCFSIRESLEAYKYTFLEGGMYDSLAGKYQRKEGEIAVSVWGRVMRKERGREGGQERVYPLKGAVVRLLKNGVETRYTYTDDEGYFQFLDGYEQCLNAACTVRVETGSDVQDARRKIEAKTVPVFTLIFPAPEPRQDSEQADGFFEGLKDRLGSLIDKALRYLRRVFMNDLAKIEQLVRGIALPARAAAKVESAELGRRYIIRNGIRSLEVRTKYSESTSADTLPVVAEGILRLWPGAVVQGLTVGSGAVEPVNLRRKPGKITLNDLTVASNGPASAESQKVVSDLGQPTVAAAFKELAARIPPGSAAHLSYNAQRFYSLQHALYLLGAPDTWLSEEWRAKLDAACPAGQTNFVVKLIRAYYSVSFEQPSSPVALFAEDVTESEARQFVKAGNPPCYVSEVTYGRALYLFVSTEESPLELRAALDAACVSAPASLNERQDEFLQKSSIQAIVVGADGGKIEFWENVSLERLKQFAEAEPGFNVEAPAIPLSCQLRYLLDNSVVSLSLKTEYEAVSHKPQNIIGVIVTFNVTAEKLKAEEVQLTVLRGKEQVGHAAFGADEVWSKRSRHSHAMTLKPSPLVTSLNDLRLLIYKTPVGATSAGGLEAAVTASCSIEDGTILHWFDRATTGFTGRSPQDITPPNGYALA